MRSHIIFQPSAHLTVLWTENFYYSATKTLCWVTFKCGFTVVSFIIGGKFGIYADASCIFIDFSSKNKLQVCPLLVLFPIPDGSNIPGNLDTRPFISQASQKNSWLKFQSEAHFKKHPESLIVISCLLKEKHNKPNKKQPPQPSHQQLCCQKIRSQHVNELFFL